MELELGEVTLAVSVSDPLSYMTALRWTREERSANGDRALSALLSVHGIIQNGGTYHAACVCSEESLSEAAAGFRYFDLSDAASVMEHISKIEDPEASDAEELFEELDRRYNTIIPDDDVIFQAFQARFVAVADDFAPL